VLEEVVCENEVILCNYHLLIPVLDLKQGLSVCNGELRDHCTHVKERPVLCDAVAVDLLEDTPILEVPVKDLVTRPHCTLRTDVLGQVAVIVGTLDLVAVLHVAVFGLDALTQLETV
jgi:hypothetical protein